MFPDTPWNRFVTVAKYVLMNHEGNKNTQHQYLLGFYDTVTDLYNLYPKDYPFHNIQSWHMSWKDMMGLPSFGFEYLYPEKVLNDTDKNNAERFINWINKVYTKIEHNG